jgi:NAD(P)-dependent dehydrogenase (short-subunit alcohol dehydrogenase family)
MAHVLITGCSSGFGLLTALRFARAGDRVTATMRSPDRAPQALREAPITLARLDVCEPASIAAAVEAAGEIDVLVNNAGIELRSSIEDASDADVRKQFETNLFGTLAVTRAVLPRMRQRGAGTIVNVSSIAGLVSRPYGGYYAATKHALEAITEALHFEVQPFGVRVVLIEPGQYDTRLLGNAFPGERFDASSPYWEASNRFDAALATLRPGGVAADPQEVADLIHAAVNDRSPKLRYLAGSDATMIAGAYRQLDFEAFEATMRESLDWRD